MQGTVSPTGADASVLLVENLASQVFLDDTILLVCCAYVANKSHQLLLYPTTIYTNR